MLLLAACAVPTGAEADVCDATWRGVESVVVAKAPGEHQPVAVECMRRVDERRVRIGFTMPPGPSCHRLTGVDVVEGADAVSITLLVSRVDDPLAGACPTEPVRTTTEVDLQAPVDDRVLLDGSRASGAAETASPSDAATMRP